MQEYDFVKIQRKGLFLINYYKLFSNTLIPELVHIIYSRVPLYTVCPIMHFLLLFNSQQEDATFKTCYE